MTEPNLPVEGDPPRDRIRVFVVEDQTMLRSALVTLLTIEDDLEVVGSVGRGDEVLEAIARLRPEVVLLDIEMPGMNGLEVAALLHEQHPEVLVLVVTVFDRPGYIRSLLASQAAGILLKDKAISDLPEAIRRVHRGERIIDPSLVGKAISEGESPLTPREAEVLDAARGTATVVQIARELHLSPGTVRNHLSAVIRKLGARSRVEAVAVAKERGWLP